jgi:SAM-dependent methyltransferase
MGEEQVRDSAVPTCPHSSPSPSQGTVVPDFRALDFQRLWRGRSRVTEVEHTILRDALRTSSGLRVLEIGPGGGHLSLVVQERAREYVAADVTPEFLIGVPVRDGVTSLRIAANVYHLSFVECAFSAVVLIRVYGFLEGPVAALAEVARVLAPRGVAVVSYNPRPSVATLADDLKTAFTRQPGERMRSMAFSRETVVPVRPSAFPAWSRTRRSFRETARDAGLEWIRELPTGLEEYRGLRRLPSTFFVNLARAYPTMGGFPSRFAVLVRRASSTSSLPSWAAILACPACKVPFGRRTGSFPERIACTNCGRTWINAGGVLDARWDGSDVRGADHPYR